jgi:hypothetical protein
VSDVLVTDVTDRSLSVLWHSSEASTGSLNVFDGPLCTVPTTGVSVVSYPLLDADPAQQTALRTVATAQGLLRVQVTGLAADTAYCFQTVTTSTSTADVTVSPTVPQAVTTQVEVTRAKTPTSGTGLVPFANDVLAHTAALPSPSTAIQASVVAVGVINLTGQPVSSVVTGVAGDTAAQPTVLLDLNNGFDTVNRQTIDVLGGERLRLLEYRGLAGCRLERFRKVPADLALAEIKAPAPCFDSADFDCNDSVNILDVLRVAGGFGTVAGGFCFNPDLDLIPSGSVNILDVLAVAGRFGLVAPP